MRVLVACEESQRVCVEFRKLGHEAYSCDILPPSGGHPEWHLQQDVIPLLKENWDLVLAFPPCTYLTNAGIAWFNVEKYGEKAKERMKKREEAFEFVMKIANCGAPHILIENPVGWLNSHWRKPDQIIHPWQFGDEEMKRTCLWLKNLPPLKSTNVVKPKKYGCCKSGKNKGKSIYWILCVTNKDGGKTRSKTFPGIAKAIAEQYHSYLTGEGGLK